MAEYIERSSAIAAIDLVLQRYYEADDVKAAEAGDDCRFALEKMEAANVEPVVHGRWIEAWVGGVCHYKCSECSEYTEETWHANFVYNYCPNCGARMERNE